MGNRTNTEWIPSETFDEEPVSSDESTQIDVVDIHGSNNNNIHDQNPIEKPVSAQIQIDNKTNQPPKFKETNGNPPIVNDLETNGNPPVENSPITRDVVPIKKNPKKKLSNTPSVEEIYKQNTTEINKQITETNGNPPMEIIPRPEVPKKVRFSPSTKGENGFGRMSIEVETTVEYLNNFSFIRDISDYKYEKLRFPIIEELNVLPDIMDETSIVFNEKLKRNKYDHNGNGENGSSYLVESIKEEELISGKNWIGKVVLVYWNDAPFKRIGFFPGIIQKYRIYNNDIQYEVKYEDDKVYWEIVDDGFMFADPLLEEDKKRVIEIRKKRGTYNLTPQRRKIKSKSRRISIVKPTDAKKRHREKYDERNDVKRKKL